jgi:hypothetical protein
MTIINAVSWWMSSIGDDFKSADMLTPFLDFVNHVTEFDSNYGLTLKKKLKVCSYLV